MQKLLTFFQQKYYVHAIFDDQNFNDTLTNDIVSFEQLGPDIPFIWSYVIEFLQCFQLNWPSTLKQFIQDCLSLSISREQYRKEIPSFRQASKGCHLSDSETALTYRIYETAKTDSEETPNDGGERVRPDRKIQCMENVYPLSASDITDDIRKGMSEKKVHEVCHMTSLIAHVIKRSECNVVVDVGSGLVSCIL